MNRKSNGINILVLLAVSTVMGIFLISSNPNIPDNPITRLSRTIQEKLHIKTLNVQEKSLLEAKVEKILHKEDFILQGAMREEFVDYLVATANKYQFDPFLILAIMKVESAFNPRAVSFAGAYGLLQLKPIAAREVVNSFDEKPILDYQLFDPFINVRFGILYLSYLRTAVGSSHGRMLSAYNLGPTHVKRRGCYSSKYSSKVLKIYNSFLKLYAV